MDVKRTKFDYTSGDLDYMGEHEDTKATDGTGGWRITKYTWDTGNCTDIQKAWSVNTTWTDRADYF